MRTPFRLLLLFPALLCACDAADDVQVQELPALERSSLEARLGLPEVRGPWRFAGWELAQGDSLGLEEELPGFGILLLQTQKRDSVAGFYLTAGGGRAPLMGEVRRDSVLALVAFPGPGDGRFLVGQVRGDTLWLEATTLAEQGSWRDDARAAFVRSQAAVTPFRRIRGVFAAAPTLPDSAAMAAGMDSLGAAGQGTTAPPPGATVGGVQPRAGAGAAGAVRPPPATTGQPAAPAAAPRVQAPPPVTPPVTGAREQPVVEEEAEEEPEPEPEPTPPPARRDPPRVLGVPVVRDTAGGQLP